MLYAVNDDRVKELSLKQLISFMFKDYPEIINGYNNDMLDVISDEIDILNKFKNNIIESNFGILSNGGISEVDESNLVKSMLKSYKFYTSSKSLKNQNIDKKVEDSEIEAEKKELELLIDKSFIF